MDLGFLPIVLPPGLCHGTPPSSYPRRGLDAFPALSPAAGYAHPPSAACLGAAGYAAGPAPDCEQPRAPTCQGEAPPRPAASLCPGRGRPTSPEPERPCSCCPVPEAAPAEPRAFEWMRMKRSTPGRSGAAPPAYSLRTSFSTRQLTELEKEFHFSRYLSRARRLEVARSLRLRDAQVKVWFQNRRMKQKKREREALPGPTAAPRAAPGGTA
ncbi:homeobox protein Hox-B1-like [Numida meleagris]|uniref:homeobox protein Hox-B1-like n=1 Tax=Numida meleagris TaxID=8996 RepID=UPI000B3DDD30|nr:homeobox protein Hox-B1-like [Numida meleagris]